MALPPGTHIGASDLTAPTGEGSIDVRRVGTTTVGTRNEINIPPAVEDKRTGGPEPPALARMLGLWDVTTITAGTILGSAIFVAAAFVPREVPHPTVALLLWVAGGLIAMAGALSYAELGTMFPEAGGQYHYLKQAFGPMWGFLFGWTSLLAIQAGAVAYLGVAFGDYLGAFVPFFSSKHVIASMAAGPWTWEANTAQLAGITAIGFLSAVNYFGTKEGAAVQGFLTAIKLLSVAGLIGFGLLAPAKVSLDWTAPLPPGNLLAAMGLAVVAVLGSFDGWYQATLSAGEIKRPERNLPLGMIGGTALIGLVYLLMNLVYFRAMPLRRSRGLLADRRRGDDCAARSGRRPAAGCGGAGVDLRLPVVCRSSALRVLGFRCRKTRRLSIGWRGFILATEHPRPASSLSVSGRCCWSCRGATNSCFNIHCSRASSSMQSRPWRCSRCDASSPTRHGPTASPATPGCRRCSSWR